MSAPDPINPAARFTTLRLSGRPVDAGALPLYVGLFGPGGRDACARDVQDWARHGLGPWVLSHASRDIGVGGFHIGFGSEGLELSFHLLPDVWGQGLASEFVSGALDFAQRILRADRIFAHVAADADSARRILGKAGFARMDAESDAMPDAAEVMAWRRDA